MRVRIWAISRGTDLVESLLLRRLVEALLRRD